MSLIDKIPAMADDALNNLHANAVRLGESGSACPARFGGQAPSGP